MNDLYFIIFIYSCLIALGFCIQYLIIYHACKSALKDFMCKYK